MHALYLGIPVPIQAHPSYVDVYFMVTSLISYTDYYVSTFHNSTELQTTSSTLLQLYRIRVFFRFAFSVWILIPHAIAPINLEVFYVTSSQLRVALNSLTCAIRVKW